MHKGELEPYKSKFRLRLTATTMEVLAGWLTGGMTDNSESRPLWNDESRDSSDIAGRHEFARVVAARIDSCLDGQGSTVFGLVGPWGSGKTTLLKGVVGQLQDWKIVWFSPWSVADVGSITAEFVSALAEAFPQASSVMDKLRTYSRFGAPVLKMIPIVGEAVSSLTVEAMSESTKRPAWHSEFGRLSDEIAEQHQRVLVVVDDVDRLDGDELRSLLRVVRLLGRFTNVHYLMAYDQATVDAVLNSTGANGDTSEFMEKIVQYPFEVPPIPMVVRRRWSRTILDTVSPMEDETDTQYAEDRENLVRILALGLETPRASERLKEQLLSLSGLLAEAEVDALDFTALTWLRITHHQIWDHIRLNSLDYLAWRENDPVETKNMRKERIDALVMRGHPKPVQEAVEYLFKPAQVQGLAGRRGRMQTGRYFDRYFQVGLAEDDVSEKRTQNALQELEHGNLSAHDVRVLEDIILGPDGERSTLALETVIGLRLPEQATSSCILTFVENIRSELKMSEKAQPFQVSSAERWLAHEIFLAMKMASFSTEEVIARFGFETLATSAYTAQRSGRYEVDQIKKLYADVVRTWVLGVRNEPLVATLARPELIQMTSFCIWIVDVEDHAGFLADRVLDGAALVDVASAYVSFNEWVGGVSIHYEVTLREEEIRFSLGEAASRGLTTEIAPISDAPDYEMSHRQDRELTNEQRRDFATRSVLRLELP